VFHLDNPDGGKAFYHLFLFIQIGNYLWVAQMGDEAFYHLFDVSFYSDWELLVEPGVPPG
jgi:hypothetical protein